MSVMTPEQLRNGGSGVDLRGRPTAPLVRQLQQAPMEPSRPQLQRQAVIDQLGTSPEPAGAQPTSGGLFARGGKVKPLPGSGLGETVGNIAGSAGVQVAGRQLGNQAAQAAGGAASSGLKGALTSGAGGAAAGAGVSLATGMLADKVRVKEEMPTFGGPNGQYLDEYGRRFEGTGGGTHANAIKYAGMGANPALAAATGGLSILGGALFGIGKAAATRNAPSAYTDFRVEDAAQAVKDAYKGELGREATDDEVMGMLTGQGWDPNGGDRWVGEKGINSVIDHIRASPEAQAFRARGSVIDQLGTGGEPTVETSVPAGAERISGSASGAAPGGPGKLPMPADAVGGASGAQETGAARTGGGGGKLEGFDGMTADGRPKIEASNSPKYVFARVARGISNTDPDRSAKILAALKADPSGYFANATLSRDKLQVNNADPIFNGIGEFDIQRDEENGGGFHWEPTDRGGQAAAAGPNASGSVDLGARRQQPDVIDDDTLARLRAELERIMSGTPDRQALLSQMGGANG